MTYTEAFEIATRVKEQLAPHCTRIEIAGSIRRKSPECRDIEIVAIPKPYNTGLFESGIATVVNKWPKVKGSLPCKYTQRELPESIKLDLFFANKHNWGLILAIRTGSSRYSHKVLGSGWVAAGYRSEGGFLYNSNNEKVDVPEEQDLFNLIGIPYAHPELRNL